MKLTQYIYLSIIMLWLFCVCACRFVCVCACVCSMQNWNMFISGMSRSRGIPKLAKMSTNSGTELLLIFTAGLVDFHCFKMDFTSNELSTLWSGLEAKQFILVDIFLTFAVVFCFHSFRKCFLNFIGNTLKQNSGSNRAVLMEKQHICH